MSSAGYKLPIADTVAGAGGAGQAADAVPLKLSPALLAAPEWIPIAELREDSPGPTENARKLAAHRQWQVLRQRPGLAGGALAERFIESGRRVLKVRRDAPWHGGKTAGELWSARHAPPPAEPAVRPPGWESATLAERERHLAAADARQRWLELREHHGEAKTHAIWEAEWGERLKAVRVGRSLRSAQRLAAWDPGKQLLADGRGKRGQARGSSPAGGMSERFQGELLYIFLGVYRGQDGTQHAS